LPAHAVKTEQHVIANTDSCSVLLPCIDRYWHKNCSLVPVIFEYP